MQGGSSSIGYGLKYQVYNRNPNISSPFSFSVLRDFSRSLKTILISFWCPRLGAYPMWKLIQNIWAFSPALSVSRKKMRFLFFKIIFGSIFYCNCWMLLKWRLVYRSTWANLVQWSFQSHRGFLFWFCCVLCALKVWVFSILSKSRLVFWFCCVLCVIITMIYVGYVASSWFSWYIYIYAYV